MDSFDYVIVGAGSAGCVLASRLSEDPGTTVALLEAGPRDWHPYIHIPAGFIKTFYDKRFNWCYEMEPCEWSGGRRIFAPRGKTLGGSSAIKDGFRQLGPARQPGLGLRGCAALFPAHGAAYRAR
jgi:choline dehydrogenase